MLFIEQGDDILARAMIQRTCNKKPSRRQRRIRFTQRV